MTTERASTKVSLITHEIEMICPDPGLAPGASADVEHTVWSLNAEPWRVRAVVALADPDVSVPPGLRPGAGTWREVLPGLRKFTHTAPRELHLPDTPVTVSPGASPPDRVVPVTVQTDITPAAFWRTEPMGPMQLGLPITTTP